VKDWAVSFIAAIALVAMVVWCVRVFIEVLYG
jgi:flagellar biogenesis protein FliO